MNGEIAQSLSLVAYANASIQGQNVVFDLGHSTAKYCKLIEFIEIPEGVDTLEERIVLAKNPQSWFELLGKLGVERLVLHHLPSRNKVFSDRMSSAFIGGGGRWVIEAIKGETSDLWEACWKTSLAKGNRLWEVYYILFATVTNRLDYVYPSLDDAYNTLKQALIEINKFAKEWASHFSKYYQKAIEYLSSGDSLEDNLPDGFEIKAKQLIRASYAGWLFGGMGSWNDIVFEDDYIEERYNVVSDNLYYAICNAVVVATNSYTANMMQVSKY